LFSRPISPRFEPPHSAFAISRIIERVHKCLDFCVTLYALHLLLCVARHGFPAHWEWWALNIGSMVALIELAAYLCSELESRGIE
jgi:hypothetical protein